MKGAARPLLVLLLVLGLLEPVGPALAAITGDPPVTLDPTGGDDGGTPVALADATHVADLQKAMLTLWLPAFMDMAQQLSAVMMDQVYAVGMLLDAKHQLETQQMLQELEAEAHRDYQPDTTMCVFGTGVRSLTATEALMETNVRSLDLTMLKRDQLSTDVSSAAGIKTDMRDRFETFKNTYCDVNDDSNYLANICNPAAADRINKDIDYTRTVEDRYTIDFDFTNGAPPTPEAEDVMALSRNLFSFHTFEMTAPDYLGQEFAKEDLQDKRSVDAMRSVIRNSFAHIVGMRAAGTAGTKPYMRVILQQLGITDPVELDQFLGKNPSYFAQMEVLTHKIYENPEFFSNLYTTPANVQRIGVTLQAFKLIQDRDRFEASLRREMLASLLLEESIRGHQGEGEEQTSKINDIIPALQVNTLAPK
jgi:hypothetical protein